MLWESNVMNWSHPRFSNCSISFVITNELATAELLQLSVSSCSNYYSTIPSFQQLFHHISISRFFSRIHVNRDVTIAMVYKFIYS